MAMNVPGLVIGSVFEVTLRNPLASHQISFSDALWWVKNLVYLHCRAHYEYHTEGVIRSKENYQEEFPCGKDFFSQFHARTPTTTIV